MNELQQSLFIITNILLLIPFLFFTLSSISYSISNIHKSISYFFIYYFILYSFYYSLRVYIECPKGIQSIFIYYQPDLLFYQCYYYRDSRIDITNNDFITLFNIHKYIQSLFLPDFIAIIGSKVLTLFHLCFLFRLVITCQLCSSKNDCISRYC